MMESSVVLPEPEAPFSMTSSPSSTSISIPFSTFVSTSPLPNAFVRLFMTTPTLFASYSISWIDFDDPHESQTAPEECYHREQTRYNHHETGIQIEWHGYGYDGIESKHDGDRHDDSDECDEYDLYQYRFHQFTVFGSYRFKNAKL